MDTELVMDGFLYELVLDITKSFLVVIYLVIFFVTKYEKSRYSNVEIQKKGNFKLSKFREIIVILKID